MRSVNYKEAFETDDSITVFEEFVKQHGGNASFKIASDFQGKQTHSAVAIGLKYFEQVTQKRLIKTVRTCFIIYSIVLTDQNCLIL